MRILGVIPTPYRSTRFEGKPFADILPKPMIQHVYERSRRAGCLDDVLVAADDARIVSAPQETPEGKLMPEWITRTVRTVARQKMREELRRRQPKPQTIAE